MKDGTGGRFALFRGGAACGILGCRLGLTESNPECLRSRGTTMKHDMPKTTTTISHTETIGEHAPHAGTGGPQGKDLSAVCSLIS